MHALIGRKQSKEHIAKRKASRAKTVMPEEDAARARHMVSFNIGRCHSKEHNLKIAKALKGKKNSLGTIRNEEFRRKLSDYWKVNRDKHNFYVDGLGEKRNSEREFDMSRLDYRLWRKAVFLRDNYTCIKCGSKNDLHADHIKPYATYPELRRSVDNGRTLCASCHRKTDTYARNSRRQIA